MKKGIIKIENNRLIYLNDRDSFKYAYYKTKSFNINIDSIKVIGIYHRLILDDEMDFLVFIDENRNKEYICITADLDSSSLSLLIEKFKLKEGFITAEFEEYEKGRNYVLYPDNLKGKSLYRKRSFIKKGIHFVLKFLKIKRIADGSLSQEVKSYLTY